LILHLITCQSIVHGTYQNVVDILEISSDDEAVPTKKAKVDRKGKGRQEIIVIDDSD
jgi:hypothetical protein